MSTAQVRSLYRNILRELPARSPSILANPSPIQQHLRLDFTNPANGVGAPSPSPSLQNEYQKPAEQRLAAAEQYLGYLRAQRKYTTLLERYNPGMNMDEEERVRLTARRVGMELPLEMPPGGHSFGGGEEK